MGSILDEVESDKQFLIADCNKKLKEERRKGTKK